MELETIVVGLRHFYRVYGKRVTWLFYIKLLVGWKEEYYKIMFETDSTGILVWHEKQEILTGMDLVQSIVVFCLFNNTDYSIQCCGGWQWTRVLDIQPRFQHLQLEEPSDPM